MVYIVFIVQRGKGCTLIFSLFLFLLLRGKGVEVNVFFFPRYMKKWKEEGGKGYIGFFWKCFFHRGKGRERFTGGNFFYKFIVGWGKGCTLIFLFFFFLLLRGKGVEDNVFFFAFI
jgi:hypothetical protein